MMEQHSVKLNEFSINNTQPFVLIAGPCQLESMDHALFMAEELVSICDALNIPFIFKSSFDKANRTSIHSQRGVGLEKSIPIFSAVKKRFGCPILTDIHNESHCSAFTDEVDIIQIPAFLCRQTDLLIAAAKSGKIVNVKKGQFMAPWDMEHVVKKIVDSGSKSILLTERGVSFGYNTLVSDMRSLEIMKETSYPVIYDATHSVQQPGGLKGASGGQRQYVETLAKAAVAVGVAGLFIETHQDPDNAPSDGPCMLPLERLKSLLETLQQIDSIIKSKKEG